MSGALRGRQDNNVEVGGGGARGPLQALWQPLAFGSGDYRSNYLEAAEAAGLVQSGRKGHGSPRCVVTLLQPMMKSPIVPAPDRGWLLLALKSSTFQSTTCTFSKAAARPNAFS